MTDNTHYFATTCLAFATGSSRSEAIERAVRNSGLKMVRQSIKNAQRYGRPGFYVWSCEVDAPLGTDYEINCFQPQDVPVTDGQHHEVNYLTAKEIAFTTRTEMD